mmetsp:Transcript_8732/g.26836  ORF Transcript_8732/g.26836 Transcript_8732/m.26836 type:complete len:136 (+) Transcript_8732:28-435(+)
MALSGWCAPLAADGKVTVVFKHAGDAPILKKCTFKLPATATLALVAEQLRKQLGLATQEPLVRRWLSESLLSHSPPSPATPLSSPFPLPAALFPSPPAAPHPQYPPFPHALLSLWCLSSCPCLPPTLTTGPPHLS